MEIVNIVATVTLNRPLDLDKLRELLPGSKMPAGSKLFLMPAVTRISGSASGWNTSTAARIASDARTSVAWPPSGFSAARIAAAPASP